LLRGREAIDFDRPVYAGVRVVGSAAMGRKLGQYIVHLIPVRRYRETAQRL
jgi:hypothetical protein